jgi:hypothetical protein
MAEFGRVCGDRANLFRAILARISHLNKLQIDYLNGLLAGSLAAQVELDTNASALGSGSTL